MSDLGRSRFESMSFLGGPRVQLMLRLGPLLLVLRCTGMDFKLGLPSVVLGGQLGLPSLVLGCQLGLPSVVLGGENCLYCFPLDCEGGLRCLVLGCRFGLHCLGQRTMPWRSAVSRAGHSVGTYQTYFRADA